MTGYSGGCHCGAIGYVYLTERSASQWSIRACQCTFCRAHDALSTSDPLARIEFSSGNLDQLQRYRFGLKTADFILCRQCGVYVGAVIETDNGKWGIINTHSLAETSPDIADVSAIEYDGEDTNGRVARREERWSPASTTW